MKISYNWLRDYVDHSMSPDELAELLTMAGLEVEGIARPGLLVDGVVIGSVLEVRKHSGADKLTVCRVDVGQEEPLQVVCGAPNVAAGQKVPVAVPGATVLVADREGGGKKVALRVRRTKLRGELSDGMICSEDELGISDDHSGIMVLNGDAPVGTPFADYLASRDMEISDAVLDVAITPNRPDAVSHIGIARDVGALTRAPLKIPNVSIPNQEGEVARAVRVEIHSPEACGRYVAMMVRGVTIGDSPVWLKQRLTAVGLRPRNNVVDVTNYVMYECGQPLHAFDYDRLEGRAIHVRLTNGEQVFTTLDGKERTLPTGTLLICDAERPVAIAGVMGGEDSEVSNSTVNILIESAWFAPSYIRRASRALSLQTDSSYRFERGVDPEGAAWAAGRAAHLMAELADGEVVMGMVDVHPRAMESKPILLRPSRVEQILGDSIPEDEVERLLAAIGFSIESSNHGLRCTPPSFRPDIEREIDIIEEVARLYGYDRLAEPTRTAVSFLRPVQLPALELRTRARQILSGFGFREVYTNSMLRQETAERFASPSLIPDYEELGIVTTLNPISREMSALRPSLLPGIIEVIAHNQNHGQESLRLMEFGRVFQKSADPGVLVPGYKEHESLLLSLSGPVEESSWDSDAREADFFDIKGMIEAAFQALRLPDIRIDAPADARGILAPGVWITHKGGRIGVVGKLTEEVASRYDLRRPVYFAEVNWDHIGLIAPSVVGVRYGKVSKFPTVKRDIAVVVPKTAPAGSLLYTIRTAGPLLKEVSIFDLYEGKGIDPEKKSVAFSIILGAERTLVEKEIDEFVRLVVKKLEQEHEAVLRQ